MAQGVMKNPLLHALRAAVVQRDTKNHTGHPQSDLQKARARETVRRLKSEGRFYGRSKPGRKTDG